MVGYIILFHMFTTALSLYGKDQPDTSQYFFLKIYFKLSISYEF